MYIRIMYPIMPYHVGLGLTLWVFVKHGNGAKYDDPIISNVFVVKVRHASYLL